VEKGLYYVGGLTNCVARFDSAWVGGTRLHGACDQSSVSLEWIVRGWAGGQEVQR
jgi:hypothetical protein